MQDSISGWVAPYFVVYNFVFSLGVLTIFLAVLDTNMRAAAANIRRLAKKSHKFNFEAPSDADAECVFKDNIVEKWGSMVGRLVEKQEMVMNFLQALICILFNFFKKLCILLI